MLWGNSHEEIFENILRLMLFGVYFERILNKKWLFSCRNNYINYSCTHMLGGGDSGAYTSTGSPEKILKNGAFWFVLVYLVIRLSLKNSPLINIFLQKNIFLCKKKMIILHVCYGNF